MIIYFLQLEDTFRNDAEETLQATPHRSDYRDAWNEAQIEVRIKLNNDMPSCVGYQKT